MKYISAIAALIVGGLIGYFVAYKQFGVMGGCTITPKQCGLKTAMRKLWADHVIWTRDYIIAAVAGAPETQLAAERLLRNQEDIGNAIIPYYGREAGQKLTALLKDHILIAADLVTAAKAKDQERVKALDQKWHDNAQEIAAFLSGANSNWPLEDMTKMMNAHLALTTEELMARLEGKWKEDIAAFDKIFDQIMNMSDHLTAGIVKQLPQKFY